jgi:hypothetical protein
MYSLYDYITALDRTRNHVAIASTSMWADFLEVYRTHHLIDAEGLRTELSSMKLSAIKKRAVTLGVSADALERADDESDIIREAVISLVVEKGE